MPPSALPGRISRKRVLFVAEAVTLAHVARIIVLARSLDPSRHVVQVACDTRYAAILASERLDVVPIRSIPSSEFQAELAAGKPVYSFETLLAYVQADLALLSAFKPDIVIGDFRLSLGVSARVAGVPYATVTNAYWSPFFTGTAFPIPVLPLTRFLPVAVAQALFDSVRPLAMRPHCQPLNRVRQQHGLPSLGNDLRRVYTDADFVLYADAEGMFPVSVLPGNHHYLGPLLWSPGVPLPDWWHHLPNDRAIVYLTLGSSGSPAVTWRVLEALAPLPVTVIVASAGAAVPARLPANARVAAYLPGIEAARRASLVISNGGSMTCQQALAAGKPVLGIASNMDQFLNMSAIANGRAGMRLRADRLNAKRIRAAVERLLDTASRPDDERIPPTIGDDQGPSRFVSWLVGATT